MQVWGPGLYQFDMAAPIIRGIAFDFLEYDFACVPFTVDDYIRLSMNNNAASHVPGELNISIVEVLMYLDCAARFDAGQFVVDTMPVFEAAKAEARNEWPPPLVEPRLEMIEELEHRCQRVVRKASLFPGVKASPFCADDLITWCFEKVSRDWNGEKETLIAEYFAAAEQNPHRYPVGLQFSQKAHELKEGTAKAPEE